MADVKRTHKPKPNDTLDAEYQVRHKPGSRFNKAERRAIVLEAYSLLKRFVEPADVIAYLMGHYKVHRASAYRLLAEARKYMLCRWKMPKDFLRANLASYASVILTSEDANYDNKIAAMKELAKLFGAYAPVQAVVAGIDAGGVDPAAAGDLLQKMHRDLLDNPEAMEHAHRLYESMGVKGLPAPSLDDRLRRNQEETARLVAEVEARGRNGNGKPRNGLVELPHPDVRAEDFPPPGEDPRDYEGQH
jgi:hypothetical protein